ncbi:MAG TPA: CpsD/CapB family tyrosine-protein kinase [Terriglobales bacterium]|nr:CpsD/CapB family tyrosine-protein kinase [Terriglobales bacterium]
MGLFYTALERADKATVADAVAAPPELEARADAPPPPTGSQALVTTWEEAEQRDLAGFPLGADTALAPAVPAREEAEALRPQTVRLGVAAAEDGLAREQYRILRTRILEALRPLGRRSLLITSAGPGEGKTMVAANLAMQFGSLREGRVLLIDADLRRAGLSDTLVPAPEIGLGQYLRGEAELEAALLEVDPWLTVLPTLRLHEEGAELLASQRMVDLMALACERFDLVLVDGAPVGPVADSRVLSRLVSASLLVVRAGVTPNDEIEQAAALLRPGLLGSVLNGAPMRKRGRYAYYSYNPETAAKEETRS